MTQFIKILVSLLTISTFGQDHLASIDGNKFKSVFQNLKYGNFKGTINGILIVQDSKKQETLIDFQESSSQLNIEYDEEEIYDVSYKKYTGESTSGKTKVRYITYASSNSFTLELNKEHFQLSLIDGACDLIINGLEYSYASEKSTEFLIITFTKEVVLLNNNNDNAGKSVKILPHSTLVIAINRNI